MTCAASTEDSRTFHSRPSKSAVCERFDEPTNAVVKPGLALQQPRLRVQLGRPRVERDAHLGAEATSSSTARFSVAPMYVVVMTRMRPPRAVTSGKRVAKVAHARPDHERADEVDRVGGRELSPQLGADVRLPLSVDEQITLAERCCRERRQRQRHRQAAIGP